MFDIRTAPVQPQPVRRADYREPDWLVPDLTLDFDLDPAATRVTGVLSVTRNGAHDRSLRLDRDGVAPERVLVDGAPADWRTSDDAVEIDLPGDAHDVTIETILAPERNTQLMGLYASGGLLCTQCEAEGFRRILPFPDRPDVLARYRVRMTADKARYPVLLANGDPVASGEAEDGRHWAEWHDPFPKPSYLFALVAGDLVANRGTFTTMSGRDVALGIWSAAPTLPRPTTRCRRSRRRWRGTRRPMAANTT